MDAKVKVKCPHCGQEGQVRAEFLGKKTRCAKCNQIFDATPVKAKKEYLVVTMESLGGTCEATCPACGTLVMAKPGALGILCPSCGKVFTAPAAPTPPPRLTMTCPYCRSSAPIEAAWIGQEGQCTECGKSFIIQADGQIGETARATDENINFMPPQQTAPPNTTRKWTSLWVILTILGYAFVLYCYFNLSSFEQYPIVCCVWFFSSALVSYVLHVRGESLNSAKVLSFFWPGLGHFYFGRIGRGIIWGIAFYVITNVIFFSAIYVSWVNNWISWGVWLARLWLEFADLERISYEQ